MKSILSYDAYLPGSQCVSRFLDDLEFSTGIRKPRSAFPFLPTAPRTEFVRGKLSVHLNSSMSASTGTVCVMAVYFQSWTTTAC